ncbi:hypothetical protein RND71_012780 [Anisodus tanguticus]|uniref:Uncharacterized protein n=1 Tax=Anisodus tanguticus TaxID=243964 RepID=A0AAE1SGH8_9SOLA|nr:hypothetical protein RND71_012780 [Anisodus tanguticus]
MSASSDSPNQEQTLDGSNSNEPKQENPHSQPQILEPHNHTNQEKTISSTQNQETPQVILDEKDLKTPDQETDEKDNPGHCSLTVLLPIEDPLVSVPDLPLMSPTNTHKRNKRKKGKCNTKKLQAIEKKLQTLKENLKPVPFFPSKILDFDRHEQLLRRLGLWEFVHIEFDRDLRVDVIAQLIATYDSKMRSCYVNEFRIMVNRADLGRALKLPVKKEKGSVDVIVLDDDPLSDESISFLEDFVSAWMLLHEDMWIIPNEVLNWTKAIKDGHHEKVDWAGLFWFMVEKELTQGDNLVDCYYAAHLQYLIKSQREQVLFSEEPEKVEFEADVKEEDDCGVGGSSGARELDGALDEELNMELTLVHDVDQKQEVKDVEMMDVEEEHKEEKEGEEEKEEGEEEKQWLFDDTNEPLLRRCKMQEAVSLDNDEEKKENHELADDNDDDDEEEEGAERHEVEDEDGFDVIPRDDTLVGDGLTGNLLQTMESTQIAFTSQGQLHDQSSVELLASRDEMHTGGPFFGNGSKREIDIEPDVAHHSLNGGSNMRLRIEGALDDKPLDFGSCMEQMQQLMMRVRMMYETKEQNEEQFNINQQIILNELHKRDSVIDHLHKSKCEEIQKRDGEICRLERELFMIGNILDGYRKAMKETQKQFSDYRKKSQLPEEPYYTDAGGGLMLSSTEMEKLRLKQEEETRSNCLFLEQKVKEAEEEYAGQFENFMDKVQLLDKKLMDLEDKVKDLRNVNPKSKVPESKEKISETPDCPPNE